jgi:hypothetical protein
MLERDMIQSKGFKNFLRNGQIAGFQLRYRTPYYRGVLCSLLEGAEVSVDGETFARDQTRWTIGNRTFTHDELAKASDVRWQFKDAAILTVTKSGGLKPGLHDVQVVLKWRRSYARIEEQPSVHTARKKMVLME